MYTLDKRCFYFWYIDNFERMAYKSMNSDMWELYIPPRANGVCPIRHMTELKVNNLKSYLTLY